MYSFAILEKSSNTTIKFAFFELRLQLLNFALSISTNNNKFILDLILNFLEPIPEFLCYIRDLNGEKL